MKKLLTMLMLAMCVFALPSCSDDDKDEPSGSKYESLILGTWSEDDYEQHIMQFQNDGRGYNKYLNVSPDWFDYEISGDKLTVIYDSDEFYDDKVNVYKIITITEEEMILQDEDGDREYYNRVD